MLDASEPPAYYPAFLNLRGKYCLVIGGGEVALRKVEGLLESGAAVTVIAPRVTASMPKQTTVLPREFRSDDLDGAWLVIAATNDPRVNALVAAESERRHIWVNVVDAPDLCSVILPAVLKRGALRIAVSTGAASPTLAMKIRQELAECYGPEYGELVTLLWRLRQQYAPAFATAALSDSARRHIWEQVLCLPLLDLLRAGGYEHACLTAEDIIRLAISAASL